MVNGPLTFYVLRAAVRDRLILACVVLTMLAVAFSLFIGGAAIVEKSQFIVVYAASVLRFLTIGAMILFTAFYVQRSYAQRDVEFLLSRPLSRTSFIVSHALALLILSAALAVLALTGLSVAGWRGWSSFYLLWGASLFTETFLTGLVSFFFSMVLTSSTVSALMAFAFYALARLSGQMLGIIHEHATSWGGAYLSPITKFISMLVPRFDLMTQSSWLIYGSQTHEGALFLMAQGGAFAFLVLVAAVIDLKRRQF